MIDPINKVLTNNYSNEDKNIKNNRLFVTEALREVIDILENKKAFSENELVERNKFFRDILDFINTTNNEEDLFNNSSKEFTNQDKEQAKLIRNPEYLEMKPSNSKEHNHNNKTSINTNIILNQNSRETYYNKLKFLESILLLNLNVSLKNIDFTFIFYLVFFFVFYFAFSMTIVYLFLRFTIHSILPF